MNKQKYRQLCKEEISIPVFSMDWWLDAVCGENNCDWDVALVEKNEQIVGAIPYYIKRKAFLFNIITMPRLTQTLGPWLAPLTGKYATQLAQQKEIFTSLIEQLPPYDFFQQNFHYSITNWLPFYWHGFTQTTRYTYVIEDLTDLDQVWNNFQSNTRRVIRKAEKEVVVRTDLDIEKFLDINTMTFQRQGRSLPYSREMVRSIDAACLKHQARRIFFAEDNQERIHAALYLIWDDYSAYYLMGGGNSILRNSGAMTLLMWEAIQFASTVTKKFDFEGSMIEPIEIFFRDFGAKQIPYFQVTHMSRGMKPLMAGRDIFKALVKPA